MLNNPYNGGTHLPDITVMSPVFVDSDKPLFFVASRGHHADIGGITPGSMPPMSTRLDEEGVVFDNVLILRDGEFREEDILRILAGGPYPARNPAQNIADLKAQIAANVRGAKNLIEMVERYGQATVTDYMRFVRENASQAVREIIDKLEDGQFSCSMDDGTRICVAIKINRELRSARVDFTGTGAQVSNNFNAPRSICRAVVLYVFRT